MQRALQTTYPAGSRYLLYIEYTELLKLIKCITVRLALHVLSCFTTKHDKTQHCVLCGVTYLKCEPNTELQ